MEAKLVFPDWWKGDFKPLTFCGGGVVSISFRKQHIEHTIQHSLCMKHTASEPLTISLLAHEREVQVPMWKILSVLIPYICIVPVTMMICSLVVHFHMQLTSYQNGSCGDRGFPI